MKKIMFNSKLGLEQAVLEGRKTQTRRLLTLTLHEGDLHGDLKEVYPYKVFRCVNRWMFEYKGKVYDIPTQNYPKYSVGEIVAIAQSYKDCGYGAIGVKYEYITKAGFNNKMFVKPELMLNKIRITNVRIERLQGISDEDCIKEGITEPTKDFPWYSFGSKSFLFNEPQQAYAALIDKVSGKGTWDNNTYVFVYDFKLVK